MLATLDATRSRRSLTRLGMLIAAILITAVVVPISVLTAGTDRSPKTEVAATQPEASEGEQEQQPLVPIELTKEEAERLLQMIRDAERQRRAILRAREAAAHKAQEVDKDW